MLLMFPAAKANSVMKLKKTYSHTACALAELMLSAHYMYPTIS